MAGLVTTGASHVAVYDWTFLLGQSLMPAISALLLGSLMYRSRLVPRIIPVLGLIGAPILITSVITALFRTDHQITVLALGFLPVAAGSCHLASISIVIAEAPRQRGVRTSNSLPSGSARHVHGTSPWPRSMSVAPSARSRAASAS